MVSAAPRAKPKRRAPSGAASASAKMRAYRKRMRAAGMRQIQVWVPDASSPAFRREVRRQSRLASRSAGDREALHAIEGLADLDGWT